MEIFKLASGRLNDTAFNVRTNAIKFLTKLVETAPYIAFERDNAKFNEVLFSRRIEEIEETFKNRFPDFYKLVLQEREKNAASEDLEMASQDESKEIKPEEDQPEQEEAEAPTDLTQLRSLLRYYTDGLLFCKLISNTVPTMCQILQSSKKAEVVESMNYFVTLQMFGLTSANVF